MAGPSVAWSSYGWGSCAFTALLPLPLHSRTRTYISPACSTKYWSTWTYKFSYDAQLAYISRQAWVGYPTPLECIEIGRAPLCLAGAASAGCICGDHALNPHRVLAWRHRTHRATMKRSTAFWALNQASLEEPFLLYFSFFSDGHLGWELVLVYRLQEVVPSSKRWSGDTWHRRNVYERS